MIIYCTSGATISAPIVDIDTTSSIFSMAPKPAWTPVSSATNSVKWGLIQMCSLIGFAVKKINVSCSSKLFLCSYCMNIAWWWSQVFNYYASPPAPPPPPPPTWIEYLTLESGGGVFYSKSLNVHLYDNPICVRQTCNAFAWHVKTLFYFQFHTHSNHISVSLVIDSSSGSLKKFVKKPTKSVAIIVLHESLAIKFSPS